ncbi:hypothetical protein C8Q80DRAFT_1220924 [Daedaleopsis nitida]|nr:hypothetical protein C8Q80DRAFT_1220924 [Daedaleopsis nitida]
MCEDDMPPLLPINYDDSDDEDDDDDDLGIEAEVADGDVVDVGSNSGGSVSGTAYRTPLPLRRHAAANQIAAGQPTPLGDVRWQSFKLSYGGPKPDGEIPTWMTDEHTVHFRDPREIVKNMLANTDFKDEIDYAPLHEFDTGSRSRRLRNFMGGDWVWRQAVSGALLRDHIMLTTICVQDAIQQLPDTKDSSFVPIILGSDKTTVSVATGQNDYYPLYASIGNVHNNVRRAHRNAVVVIAFLAIPKRMTRPEVTRCGDRHFRKVVYRVGPYIADYPEQALVASIVQGWCPGCTASSKCLDEDASAVSRTREVVDRLTVLCDLGPLWNEYGIVGDVVPFTNDFPRADIHELLSPDILHQLVKGTFKDHLVLWVEHYLRRQYNEGRATEIMAEIDCRIAVAPPFSQLRHFHEGRGFKRWTGDDSKALMKVYLPAIDGLLPTDVVKIFRYFLEFCYLVRRDMHDEKTVGQVGESLRMFRHYREIFRTSGVRTEGFSLPRQHSLEHYEDHIWDFAAPNALCSSITESKHIKAVKEPWRRSNRYQALDQMLLTNQRLDKLAAAHVDFAERGMLGGTCLESVQLQVEGERQHSRTADGLDKEFSIPNLRDHIRRFLFHQIHANSGISGANLSLDICPPFEDERIYVHYSASATYYAPSDPSGLGGMHQEFIRATPKWRHGAARYDCVLINKSNNAPSLLGLDVARVRLLFSFHYHGVAYPCAAVHWFWRTDDEPDKDTGMWVVEPAFIPGVGRSRRRMPLISVIHLDTIIRAAHLIGVSIGDPVPISLHSHQSLDHFKSFFVNKFVDHHAFELLHTVVAVPRADERS